MDEVEVNEHYEKWRKPAIGFIAFIVVLILYLFAYPYVLIKVAAGNYFHNVPEWIDTEWLQTAINWSVVPLDWIYENVEWYEKLIDRWLAENE